MVFGFICIYMLTQMDALSFVYYFKYQFYTGFVGVGGSSKFFYFLFWYLMQIGRSYVVSKLKNYPKFQAVAIAIQRSGFKV